MILFRAWKFVLPALLLPALAFAYLPPAHYIYGKLAEQKGKTTTSAVTITVARPQASGTEEILGTLNISGWKPSSTSWPTLSLLFENDPETLIRSAQAFGLPVARESDLLRVGRDQLSAMKEPPRPFYKLDRSVSLARARQTYAWVHGNKELGKSLWIERDTYLPLKITAPCPAAVATLGWAKAGENKCEVEFRNLYALRRGNFQNTRITLWKDGAPLLFFSFERLSVPRSGAVVDEKIPADVKEIAETILH